MTRFALAAALAAGCSTSAFPVAATDPRATGLPTIATLHADTLARTCALNGGVCHNSKEFPDLHTVSNLLHAIGQPCLGPSDACEPEGDRLAIPSLSLDEEIAHLDGADLLLLSPASPAGATAPDAEIRRGPSRLPLSVPSLILDDGRVHLDLAAAPSEIRQFLTDDLRVADPNGNGLPGHTLGHALIVPGSPERSYLLRRLTDPSEGDLMPKQCREWSDLATRTLGCWIEGLTLAPDGTVANALAPIDLARCRYSPPPGRCGPAPTTGFAAASALFTRSCGGSSCHLDEAHPASSLDLTPAHARNNLVGVPATEAPARKRVTPGSPDESYLFCKVDPRCATRVGARMPLDGPGLSDSDLSLLRTWIETGAD